MNLGGPRGQVGVVSSELSEPTCVRFTSQWGRTANCTDDGNDRIAHRSRLCLAGYLIVGRLTRRSEGRSHGWFPTWSRRSSWWCMCTPMVTSASLTDTEALVNGRRSTARREVGLALVGLIAHVGLYDDRVALGARSHDERECGLSAGVSENRSLHLRGGRSLPVNVDGDRRLRRGGGVDRHGFGGPRRWG